jgi:hypothetical protein
VVQKEWGVELEEFVKLQKRNQNRVLNLFLHHIDMSVVIAQ